MNLVGLLILALIVGFVIYKLKNLFHKAKDQTLIKEDERLKTQQTVLEQEVNKLKENLNKPIDNLTPEQIEEFWKDDKK